ncbi:ATP-dependent Clp protease ATP-binding subunit [Anaerotalea alkaliphila]
MRLKCAMCRKNTAVVFVTKYREGKQTREGICLPCAQKHGVAPMEQLLGQTGLTQEDMENINAQMMEILGDPGMREQMAGMVEQFMGSMPEMFGDPGSTGEPQGLEEGFRDSGPEEEGEPGRGSARTRTKERQERRKRKNLDAFGINLTDKARDNQVDRIVGRHREIDRVIQILNRRQKNNPVLIGEPGVGKTAIAEGLAVRIVQKQVPVKLQQTDVYLLDLTAVVAGTQFRGQFEARMKAILDEAKADGKVLLVIDEIHNIAGAGEADNGAMNAANILKPALARGEVQVVGATTLEEYRKHIEKDSALERRFQPVLVEEPSIQESIEIIRGIRDYYEDFHKVRIPDSVIESAVVLSERYIQDRFLPDKAIDVIDEAGSRANLLNMGLVELEALRAQLDRIVEEKEEAADMDHYERAAECRIEELRLEDKIGDLEERCTHVEITQEDVAYVIEAWTRIPVGTVGEEEATKLMSLERRLHRRIVGQEEAVRKLSKAIRRNRSGFKKKRKPSSFIFVGPTGVGKTELAKAVAEELFGDEEALIRFDMSEFMEKHTVSKLIGAPPGYVGYEQAGQLTEKVRRKPYSVLLLDEIEKAHGDVFNLLLQILEDGRLTDSQGRRVNFENTVLIMTSNAGTDNKGTVLGFAAQEQKALQDKSLDALKQFFRPEFLNRVDEVVVFEPMTREMLVEILELMVREVVVSAREKGIKLELSQEIKELVLAKGWDPKYGARPLRRTIQRLVEDEVAEAYLTGKVREGQAVLVGAEDGQVVLSIRPS